MRIQVDVERSLKSGKLIAVKTTLEQKTNRLFYILLALCFVFLGIIMPLAFFFKMIFGGNIELISFLILVPFFGVGFVTLYGIIYDDKLMVFKFKKTTTQTNIERAIVTLKDFYKTDLIHVGDGIVTYYKRATLWQFALRVVVLFKDDQVLVNISRFNQLGIKSFVHPIFSRIQARRLFRSQQ
jgi:hypothetical protein